MTTVADQLKEQASRIASAPPAEIAALLREALKLVAVWPLSLSEAVVTDTEHSVGPFAVVLHARQFSASSQEPGTVLAGACAAVIDVIPKLDLPALRAAHQRITAVKALKRPPLPNFESLPVSSRTAGIIFARSTEGSIDEVVSEFQRLNSERSINEWTEMLVMADAGFVGLAVQFPGLQKLSGDLVPPEAAPKPAPPFYMVPVFWPYRDYAINKIAAYLAVQVAIFSPGSKPPSFPSFLEGMPASVITLGGYQFDVNGNVKLVPAEQYTGRQLPRSPLRLVSGQKTLGEVDYIPWQDGGVIISSGNFPLEGLLVFLNQVPPKGLLITRPSPELQLSAVLPISFADFQQVLLRFQQRSNTRVLPSDANWMAKKVSDEGLSSPYVARLTFGILTLRDSTLLDEQERLVFDTNFDHLSTAIRDARSAREEAREVWRAHEERAREGTIIRRDGRMVHVTETVDKELRRLTAEFLLASSRALKHCLQSLAKDLGADLGFWFKQQEAFEKGVSVLRERDPQLADYIAAARHGWSERLVFRRNSIEHESWRLPDVTYSVTEDGTGAIEPLIDGLPFTEFMDVSFDRLCCACEELMAHLLSTRLPTGVGLLEIPIAERDKSIPVRFKLTLKADGQPHWQLAHHTISFLAA